MIETWVLIGILACFMQNLRSLIQKKLQKKLSITGATYTRFGYALPFVIIYFYLLMIIFDYKFPILNTKFIFYCFIGGLSQIAATYLLLKTFLLKNFLVANAYTKTEPLLAAFLGIIILGEKLTFLGFLYIFIAVLGVLIMSITTDFRKVYKKNKIFGYSLFIGILSGLLFAVAAVCFRGASISLNHDNPLLASGTTLLIAIIIQFIIFTVFLIYKEPGQFILSFKNLKYSLIVGLSGATASMGWFYCMAIQNVAYVRALGQIELLFSFIVSVLYLKEKVKFNEIIGIFLLLFGIILIILKI